MRGIIHIDPRNYPYKFASTQVRFSKTSKVINMANKKTKPTVLIIMDGIGISEAKKGNAVLQAKTPTLDNLWGKYPHGYLSASGVDVGLSWGMMGGSEVGHLNIGAGRVIYQGMELINRFISSGEFFNNPVLNKAVGHIRKHNSNIHLMGLLSTGGVHATMEHLHAILRFLKQKKVKQSVYIHLFTDGRDMPPQSAPMLLQGLEGMIKEVKIGIPATMIGRFYAMDRDNNWQRTEKAYRLLTEGKGEKVNSFENALKKSYQNKIFDEYLEPKILVKKSFWGKQEKLPIIKDNDAAIFYNFRADRARQLTKAFVIDDFRGFKREKIQNLFFATLSTKERRLAKDGRFFGKGKGGSEDFGNQYAYRYKELFKDQSEEYIVSLFKDIPFINIFHKYSTSELSQKV